MNLEITRAGLSLVELGQDFAWVTILGTHGSSPRHAGAAMVVRKDGSIAGTIGGGPLEATVIKEALEVLKAQESRIADFESAELGMLCGGEGRLLIEHVDATHPATQELFRGMLEVLTSGRRGWLVTAISAEAGPLSAVRRCLVDSNGSIAGDPLCEPEALQALRKSGGTYDQIISGDPERTHVQPIGGQGIAYVFGAGHCGEKLIPVLSMIGFSTVVVDDRPDFANEVRFPRADRIVVPESFAAAVETLSIDERGYVIIVTRGHAHDRDVLAQALKTPACYIGMIGSKSKVAKTFEALEKQGFSPDDLARVHAPIGLSIGAETPEEIAVSIAAQVIQFRAARSE